MDRTLYIRTPFITTCCHKILVIVCSIFLVACKKETSEVRILFTGDILLSRNVEAEIALKQKNPWEKLMPVFGMADIVIGNLEGAIGDQKILSHKYTSPVFNILPERISLLKNAGFKVLTLENNHSLDLGLKAKENTASLLQQHQLVPVSVADSPYFLKVKNVIIGIVAINLVNGNGGNAPPFPSVEIEQKLRLAKSLSNMVVVSIHWGSELLDWPNSTQRRVATWLIRHGADLIIGSHPHVIQQPELVEGKPVFFSLGNHLFDQKYISTKKGLIVDCRIKDGFFTCNGLITQTCKNSFFPEISHDTLYGFPPMPLKSKFKVNDLTIEPMPVKVGNRKVTLLRAYKHNQFIWQSHPMALVSIDKGKFNGNLEWLFTLENYYSTIDRKTNVRPYVYAADATGLAARWRGSALAWPTLDAVLLDDHSLCVLHRGDAYINLNENSKEMRVATYQWNGFGFSGKGDQSCKKCNDHFSRDTLNSF